MFCTGKEQLTCNSEKMGCEGCFYFNDENNKKINNEEDLKILEDLKNIFIHLKNHGWVNDIKKEVAADKVIQAIENLIAENKQLKEDNINLNDKLQMTKNSVVIGNLDVVDDKTLKTKAEKMLEKLDKEEKELQESISDEEREEYSDAMISWQLCDIEGKRKMLQELLKN